VFQEPTESDDLLREATRALRKTPLRDDFLSISENAVLRDFAPRRASRYRGVLLLAGLGAAAVAATVLFMPSKSYAAELRRIAQNGGEGMRHVRTLQVQPDGSLQLVDELFSDGVRTRWIIRDSGQILWANGEVRYLQADGATEVHARFGDKQFVHWMDEPADKILAFNKANSGTRVVAEHGLTEHGLGWNGSSADRYTIDEDFIDGRGQRLHSHMVLIADSASARPLEMRTNYTGPPEADITGLHPQIIRWEYANLDPKLFELPASDPSRVYNIDEEQELIKTALGHRGKRVTIGGQTVELLQLWVDELGNACAIAACDYAYPDNYGIAIDGKKLEVVPEGEPFSGRYHVHEPSRQAGRSIQLFHGVTGNHGPRVRYPDVVTLEIPVFENHVLAGHAKFENVRVHRSHNVWMLLEPMNIPFWDKSGMVAASTRAAP